MLEFGPKHDIEALAASYQRSGRVQIREFLASDSARVVETMLKQQTPWGLCFNQGDRVAGLRGSDVAHLTPEKRSQIMHAVTQGARDGFQFFYQHFPLHSDYFAASASDVPLFRLFEFINSTAFLDRVRQITGHGDIAWADAHATCYQPGHFLMRHNDEMPDAERRAAYVLNFTRDWRPDWGGFLQFFDDNGDVEHGFRPLFNAINIFSVPCDHSVEAVSPFAQAPRLSVTGWLRADRPPGDIGSRASSNAPRPT